ncbi:MAG: GMC family oxidoreductase [Henriciella sp.]|nr:GMC family oxidoreductase [Henriciella sp.]
MAEFDVIVVGSGMSGGWVAKEMCEQGFKVAVIERGRSISPTEDYSDFINPWDVEHLNRKTAQDLEDYRIQSEVYAFQSYTRQFWVKDTEHPYETAEGTDFRWLRGYHEGGKSIMWARQSYRLSEIDFRANKTDGHGVDWPVRYDDLSPWYDYVERFAGISGSVEGLEILPDGIYQPPHDLTCAELDFRDRIEAEFPGRRVIPGRAANLTEPTQEQMDLGRGKCQARNHCFQGCSFGAYFSSNSATLPAARRTGNLTFISDRAVHKVIIEEATGKAAGVETVDTKTGERSRVTARVVFLNAGTIPSTMIMLNSASEQAPNGLGNSSGQLGRNLMDHHSGARGSAILPGHLDKHTFGRRPNGFYIPRFRNHTEEAEGFVRGYGYQGGAMRTSWWSAMDKKGIGDELKFDARTPGPWRISVVAFGEVLPNERNQIRLHPNKTDKWGFPIPILDAAWGENERNMVRQATRDTRAMLEAAGGIDIQTEDPETVEPAPPGIGIHEMGTARMGRDPSTSFLNKWNQSWDIPNLFITDGSFMSSGGCQNPSLTYMAFSARAANHAAELMKDGTI